MPFREIFEHVLKESEVRLNEDKRGKKMIEVPLKQHFLNSKFDDGRKMYDSPEDLIAATVRTASGKYGIVRSVSKELDAEGFPLKVVITADEDTPIKKGIEVSTEGMLAPREVRVATVDMNDETKKRVTGLINAGKSDDEIVNDLFDPAQYQHSPENEQQVRDLLASVRSTLPKEEQSPSAKLLAQIKNRAVELGKVNNIPVEDYVKSLDRADFLASAYDDITDEELVDDIKFFNEEAQKPEEPEEEIKEPAEGEEIDWGKELGESKLNETRYQVVIPGLNDMDNMKDQRETSATSEKQAIANIISRLARNNKGLVYKGINVSPQNIGLLISKVQARVTRLGESKTQDAYDNMKAQLKIEKDPKKREQLQQDIMDIEDHWKQMWENFIKENIGIDPHMLIMAGHNPNNVAYVWYYDEIKKQVIGSDKVGSHDDNMFATVASKKDAIRGRVFTLQGKTFLIIYGDVAGKRNPTDEEVRDIYLKVSKQYSKPIDYVVNELGEEMKIVESKVREAKDPEMSFHYLVGSIKGLLQSWSMIEHMENPLNYIKERLEALYKEMNESKKINEALTEKGKETIKKWMSTMKPREVAIKMVDNALMKKMGLTSSELPDTSTFANGLDGIEEWLKEGNLDAAWDEAKETATLMFQDAKDEMGFESKMSDLDIEMKELKKDLHAAYAKGDKKAVAAIQDRLSSLLPKPAGKKYASKGDPFDPDDPAPISESKVNEEEGLIGNNATAVAPVPAPEVEKTEEPVAAEPVAEEPKKEEDKPTKEYLGNNGSSDYFYLVNVTGNDGTVTELQVTDAEEKVIYTTKDSDMDINDVAGFINAAIKAKEIANISTDILNKYLMPEEKPEAEVAQEEDKQALPEEEPKMESLMKKYKLDKISDLMEKYKLNEEDEVIEEEPVAEEEVPSEEPIADETPVVDGPAEEPVIASPVPEEEGIEVPVEEPKTSEEAKTKIMLEYPEEPFTSLALAYADSLVNSPDVYSPVRQLQYEGQWVNADDFTKMAKIVGELNGFNGTETAKKLSDKFGGDSSKYRIGRNNFVVVDIVVRDMSAAHSLEAVKDLVGASAVEDMGEGMVRIQFGRKN